MRGPYIDFPDAKQFAVWEPAEKAEFLFNCFRHLESRLELLSGRIIGIGLRSSETDLHNQRVRARLDEECERAEAAGGLSWREKLGAVVWACKNCRYWEELPETTDPEVKEGFCRRFRVATIRPVTTEHEWCGEFKSSLWAAEVDRAREL